MKRILILAVVCLITAAGTFLMMNTSVDAESKGIEGESAWSTRCANPENMKAKNKRGLCEINQVLSIQAPDGSQKRLAEFAIGYPEDKKIARGIIVLPLGIFVKDGLEVQVDENSPFQFQIRYCDSTGCFAYLNLNDQVLDVMKKGTEMTLRFKSIKPQNIEVKMSLKGITKALDNIS